MAKRCALEKLNKPTSNNDGQKSEKFVDSKYEFEFLLYKFSCNCCFVTRVNQMTMMELSWPRSMP